MLAYIRSHPRITFAMLLIGVSFISIGVAVLLYGRVNVSVEGVETDTVSIRVFNEDEEVVAESNNSNAGFTLRHGTYFIEVSSGSQYTRQTEQVGIFTYKNIILTLEESQALQPLTNIDTAAVNVYADGRKFIDTVVRRMTFVTDNGELRYVGPNNAAFATWSDAENGLLVARDTTSRSLVLYNIDGSQFEKLMIPGFDDFSRISMVSFGTGYYVLVDGTLLEYSDGEFVERAEFDASSILSSASSNAVLFQSQEIVQGEPSQKLTLYSITNDSRTEIPMSYSHSRYGGVTTSWSSDGARFVVNSSGGSRVYDATGTELDTEIPSRVITAASWSEDALIYASSDVLWRYDFDEQRLSSIGSLLNYMVIKSIVASDSDVYVIADQQNSGSSLFKQAADSDVTGEILNESDVTYLEPACFMNYLNYSKKNIVIYDPKSNESACEAAVKNYIDLLQVDDEIAIQVYEGGLFGRSQ